MLITALLIHFLLPHETNNHRAKILHPIFISISVLMFILSQVLVPFVPNFTPAVLGYASSITPGEIITLTNKEREKQGLGVLSHDPDLSIAAMAKASDMFAKDYWAHISPDGTQPWAFFISSGYQYKYAGENLARDFFGSKDVVEAWMKSKTHRENLLATRYEDMGVAVVDGEMEGLKTTLVVQFFGTKFGSTATVVPPGVESEVSTVSPPSTFEGGLVAGTGSIPKNLFGSLNSSEARFILSPFSSAKRAAIFFVSLFVTIFSIDMILIKHKNVYRRSSRSLAHFLFFSVILVALLAAKAGVIL